MVPKIHILPEHIASKIAAGEVIERPASVVKELIENSIDAGATQITIEIRGGGERLIKVADNGCGISKEDALLAFQRHATSKIFRLEDLNAITTLGFRGEALYSISAVSRVELITRTSNSIAGIKVLVEGNLVKEVKEAGSPLGTIVSVRDLFYNTPARLKFLKTPFTELGHISNVVSHYVLAFPRISFNLIQDGREILKTPLSSNHLERIAAIYGKELAEALLELRYESDDLDLGGFISKPEVNRATRSQQLIFINNRFTYNRTISHALQAAYHTLLPPERYPIVILFIKIDPKEVDVNVHPTKREVRFRQERLIHDQVVKAIRETLELSQLTPEIKLPSPEFRDEELSPLPEPSAREMLIKDSIAKYLAKSELRLESPIPEPQPLTVKPSVIPLTQLYNTYIVAESSEGIVLIDQHAASERILYEELMEKEGDLKASQGLLVPITLEVGPKQGFILSQYLLDLSRFGLEMESFGGNTYIIRTLPTALGKIEARQLVLDILDDLLEMEEIKEPVKRRERLLTILACRGAVKAGHRLKSEEVEALIARLGRTRMPSTCPHGRPTMIKLTKGDLEKWFKR